MPGEIRSSTSGPLCTVVLHNPSRRNALTRYMLVGLAQEIIRLDSDDSVRAIVLTGAGTEDFSAGVDLSDLEEAAEYSERSGHKLGNELEQLLGVTRSCLTPIVAKIHGHCLGGGLAIALAADIRLCDEAASFSVPAARLGLGFTDVDPLLTLIGPAHTADLLLTGRRYNAIQAAQIGLVNLVCDSKELGQTASAIASRIAENAPLSVRAIKLALLDATRPNSLRQPELLAKAADECHRSRDFLEGRRAFQEKRKPNFDGT